MIPFGNTQEISRLGPFFRRHLDQKYRNVSAPHCAVRFTSHWAKVIDLQSTNGTFVEGRRIPSHRPTQLLEGFELTLAVDRFERNLSALQIGVTYDL